MTDSAGLDKSNLRQLGGLLGVDGFVVNHLGHVVEVPDVRGVDGVERLPGHLRDGFALVDAYAANPADLVLVGVDSGDTDGDGAIGLLLGMTPSAVIIVVGSVVDLQPLATAYVRGARGLLLWNPTRYSDPEVIPTARSYGDDTGKLRKPVPIDQRNPAGRSRTRRWAKRTVNDWLGCNGS
jgi:hypothetical protein